MGPAIQNQKKSLFFWYKIEEVPEGEKEEKWCKASARVCNNVYDTSDEMDHGQDKNGWSPQQIMKIF